MRSATRPAAALSGTAELERLARSGVVSVRLARRARIVLLAIRGIDDVAIAQAVGVGRAQVARWRKRYAEGGLDAITADRPRTGRKPKVDAARVLGLTHQTAPDGSRLTGRRIAAACGVSDSTVVRIWQRHGLSRRHAAMHADASASAVDCASVRILGVFLGSRARALAVCAARAAPSATDPIMVAGPVCVTDAVDAADLAWIDFLYRIRNACPADGRVTLVCDVRRTVSRPDMQTWLAATAGFTVDLAPSALAWRARVDRVLQSPHCYGDEGNPGVSGFCELIAKLVAYFSGPKCGNVPFVWAYDAIRPAAEAQRTKISPAVRAFGDRMPRPDLGTMTLTGPSANGARPALVQV